MELAVPALTGVLEGEDERVVVPGVWLADGTVLRLGEGSGIWLGDDKGLRLGEGSGVWLGDDTGLRLCEDSGLRLGEGRRHCWVGELHVWVVQVTNREPVGPGT